jgi:hypothetical protein
MKRTEWLQKTRKMGFENISSVGDGQSTAIATVQKRVGGCGNREHPKPAAYLERDLRIRLGDRREPG